MLSAKSSTGRRTSHKPGTIRVSQTMTYPAPPTGPLGFRPSRSPGCRSRQTGPGAINAAPDRTPDTPLKAPSWDQARLPNRASRSQPLTSKHGEGGSKHYSEAAPRTGGISGRHPSSSKQSREGLPRKGYPAPQRRSPRDIIQARRQGRTPRDSHVWGHPIYVPL